MRMPSEASESAIPFPSPRPAPVMRATRLARGKAGAPVPFDFRSGHPERSRGVSVRAVLLFDGSTRKYTPKRAPDSPHARRQHRAVVPLFHAGGPLLQLGQQPVHQPLGAPGVGRALQEGGQALAAILFVVGVLDL